jgi:hypothetical protein
MTRLEELKAKRDAAWDAYEAAYTTALMLLKAAYTTANAA